MSCNGKHDFCLEIAVVISQECVLFDFELRHYVRLLIQGRGSS